ncbi:hypothetical protein CYMTET_35893, partial [Cymbomonas tetramitiformis]
MTVKGKLGARSQRVVDGHGYFPGMIHVATLCALGIIPGSITYLLLANASPDQWGLSDDVVWQELPGWGTGISIVGSGLSFLLVFRVNWAFGRWWDARGLAGEASTGLRDLCITLSSADTTCEDAVKVRQEMYDVCKAWFGTIVDMLKGAFAPEYIARTPLRACTDTGVPFKRQLRRRFDVLGSEAAVSQRKLLAPAKVAVGQSESSRNNGGTEDMQDLMPYHFNAIKTCAGDTDRILLAHHWLAHAIKEAVRLNLVGAQEHKQILSQKHNLLLKGYGMLKIKNTPVPAPMTDLTRVLLIVYVLMLPQYLAYAFNMKLSASALEEGYSLTGYIMSMFICVNVLIITFFACLRFLAIQMDDPYGEDPFDLPLAKYRDSLWKDIDRMQE